MSSSKNLELKKTAFLSKSNSAFIIYCPKSSVPINAPMITINKAKTTVWLSPSMIWGNARGNSIFNNLWTRVTPDIEPAS